MRTPFGKIDALSISGELSVPLVIIWKTENKQKSFHGFVPALSKKDIISHNLEDCKTALKAEALKLIKQYKNTEFPFFPSKEEILKDFENVCYLTFIKIKSEKRKNN